MNITKFNNIKGNRFKCAFEIECIISNKNINSRNKLLEVLVNQFDNVVTKYKMMVKSINADK